MLINVQSCVLLSGDLYASWTYMYHLQAFLCNVCLLSPKKKCRFDMAVAFLYLFLHLHVVPKVVFIHVSISLEG